MSEFLSQSGLLKGVKIIDTTINLPGPVAGAILGMLGAVITKIESSSGDPVSSSPALYRTINGMKNRIRLDLHNPQDKQEFLRLVSEADGILVGMRPTALAKLGLDYEILKAINPKLIYCHVAGFPKDSKKKGTPGHDLTYLAESGLLSTLFSDLTKVTTQPADMTGALYTAIAFLSGLQFRNSTGTGTSIEINLYESPAILGLIPNHDNRLSKNLQGDQICYRVYETADGWIALGALEEKFFNSFVQAIDHPEWMGKGDKLAEPGDEIFEAMKKIFKSQPSGYWVSIGAQHDVPLEEVRSLSPSKEFSLPYRF
ncbi:CoA transferase [Cytobacillus sp. Hz8]|uniref:CoA transferase n=1 Tax=Cytobacillus sp. Hz8 TaxID=3347168 RepID=UPI0035DB6548